MSPKPIEPLDFSNYDYDHNIGSLEKLEYKLQEIYRKLNEIIERLNARQ